VAQQSGREFTPAVSTTRTSDGEVQAVRTLQKFAAAHASIHNHCNLDRHLNPCDIFKQNRVAALAEWRQLAA
jgi:putative transposase